MSSEASCICAVFFKSTCKTSTYSSLFSGGFSGHHLKLPLFRTLFVAFMCLKNQCNDETELLGILRFFV